MGKNRVFMELDENSDFFEGGTLTLDGPEALITEDADSVFFVEKGSVILYTVPISKGEMERRKQVLVMNEGDSFPAYCYRDEEYTVWSFLVVPQTGSAVLKFTPNGVTKPMKANFIAKTGISDIDYQMEGFDTCLKNDYLGDSLQQEEFILSTAKNKRELLGKTVGTIVTIMRGNGDSAREGELGLYNAAAQVCSHYGIAVADEMRIQAACGTEPKLSDIARISNFTCRKIVLPKKWYQSDCGGIVGKIGETHIGCYWGKGGKYYIFDGEKDRPLTEAIAQSIDPKAYQIGRALPMKPISGKELFAFCRKSVPVRGIVSLLLVGLAVTLIGILKPTLNQKIYDEYIALGDFGMVAQMCVLIGSFMLGNVFFTAVKKLTEFLISCHVNYDIQNAVYWRIFQLPESFFRDYDSADLAQRLGKVGSSAGEVTTAIVGTGFSAIFSLFYLWRMIKYSKKLTLWAFFITLIYTLFLFYLESRSLRYESLEADVNGKAVSKLYQFLGGVDKIRMAGAEERAQLEYMIPFAQEQKYNILENRISAFGSTLNDVVTYLFTMVFYFIIVQKKQEITVGNFTAFNAAFGVFSSAMLQLVKTGISVYRLKPIYERVKPVFTAQPEDTGNKQIVTSLDGAVGLEHVTFAYSKSSGNVLRDVSFQIQPGEYVAIVGPSGCGKSTLLKLLLGFEQPSGGKITYDGKNLNNLDVHSLRKCLGVVLQNGKLIAGSIFENITITAPGAKMDEVNRVIEKVGLKPDIDQMPMGVHTVMSESGNTISGGQQQRILIARSIMNHPKILYFDEATSALDNRTQAMVCESLAEMHMTRVVIAHRLSTVENCDRIIVMRDGQIVEEGNYRVLMEKKGLFFDMAKRQLAEE